MILNYVLISDKCFMCVDKKKTREKIDMVLRQLSYQTEYIHFVFLIFIFFKTFITNHRTDQSAKNDPDYDRIPHLQIPSLFQYFRKNANLINIL